MSNAVIRVENLSKRYQLGTIGYGSLQNDLKAWWARTRGKEDPNAKIGEKSRLDQHGEFWALREVGFEVNQGDRLGVVGKNGAGKSTLLKLLSRVTSPTTGTIKVRGRVASLLEVGTGFHPELTGRENVFLNGAILGMKRREIQTKFDEIVAFAGVETFIDTPVKRYSSGMYVRLAFSVAAHLNSETLIIDEVLAVGDAEFQKKCLGKMEDISRGEGRTILFVSHNLSAIRTLCTRGIYLESGLVKMDSAIEPLVREYTRFDIDAATAVVSWTGSVGDESVLLKSTWVKPLPGTEFETSVDLEIGISVEVLKPLVGLVLGFSLLNGSGETIAYVLQDDAESSAPPTIQSGHLTRRFTIPANTLAHGEYSIRFDVGIHLVKRIILDEGSLRFALSNSRGLGRRFLVEQNSKGWEGIFRPAWKVTTE